MMMYAIRKNVEIMYKNNVNHKFFKTLETSMTIILCVLYRQKKISV